MLCSNIISSMLYVHILMLAGTHSLLLVVTQWLLIKITSEALYSCGSHPGVQASPGTVSKSPRKRLIKSHNSSIPWIFGWITSQGTQLSDKCPTWSDSAAQSENVCDLLEWTYHICALLLLLLLLHYENVSVSCDDLVIKRLPLPSGIKKGMANKGGVMVVLYMTYYGNRG